MQSYKEPHRELHQSTRAIVAGYSPDLSERSVKPPVFRTSTFQFKDAEEAERFFLQAYHPDLANGFDDGLIYSRINNPNVEIWEDKMVAVENGAAYAAAFPSGMSAISTTILSVVPLDGNVLYTDPVYGGTYFFLEQLGQRFGINASSVPSGDLAAIERTLREASRPYDLIFIETPANPTMTMTDIQAVVDMAARYGDGATLVAVDNTFLGPVFQKPFECGANLVLYSATKYLGGHSDLLAGIVLVRDDERAAATIRRIKDFRTILGPTLAPDAAWMLTRSLETCWIRMERQAEKAAKVAGALERHPKVERVKFPGLLTADDGEEHQTYLKQCSGSGSMICFYLKDACKEAAFRFLNGVKIVHLAVSLGGTESLIEHPRTMTHSDMTPEELDRAGISDGMIRLSVGLESSDDIIQDLVCALGAV